MGGGGVQAMSELFEIFFESTLTGLLIDLGQLLLAQVVLGTEITLKYSYIVREAIIKNGKKISLCQNPFHAL